MHPADGGHYSIQESTRNTTHKMLHTPVRKGVPGIKDAEEWGQKFHSGPEADGETPLPGTSMGDRITQMELYLGESDETPVNIEWVKEHKTTIIPPPKNKFLRSDTLSFGEGRIGSSNKEVRTHSLQSGFPWSSS